MLFRSQRSGTRFITLTGGNSREDQPACAFSFALNLHRIQLFRSPLSRCCVILQFLIEFPEYRYESVLSLMALWRRIVQSKW